MVLVLLGIVFVQDLQRHLHALQALLHISFVLDKSPLLLGAQLVLFRLRREQARERLLQRGHLLLELCRGRRHPVSLRAQLLDLAGLITRLLGGLCKLLITESLVGGVLVGLLLKSLHHILDQALDLGERVLAVVGADSDRGAHARGELRELRRALLLREVADKAHGLELSQPRARRDLRALCSLQEGHLVQAVAEILRATNALLDDTLGLGQCLELLTAAFGLSLKVLGLGHARLVQVPLGLGVCGQILGGRLEVALGRSLGLAVRSDAFLGIIHVLVGHLDLVLQRLLEHLEVVGTGGLLVPQIVQLRLGLLQQALQGLDDVATVALVNGSRRRAQGHFVLHLVGRRLVRGSALHEGREPLRIRRADRRSLHQHAERLRQVLRVLHLQHGRAALVHLALEYGHGSLQDGDRLGELGLLLGEVGRLLHADLRGGLEIGLVGGDV
mmetsp:Transcript_63315/g.166041  ORF Transcript_63315/g.166041 Transcript_63315/m.166041 type:complete len:445 (+) Transcript_63315:522-1856(+)